MHYTKSIYLETNKILHIYSQSNSSSSRCNRW